MAARFDGAALGPVLLISSLAVALTAWQVRVDRSVFERFFGSMHPTGVVAAVSLLGLVALGHLGAVSDFAVVHPPRWGPALRFIAWAAPAFTVAAIGADVVFRYAEDTNVGLPHALRFYPAVAVFAELAFHVLPLALLGTVLGMPVRVDADFWRLAVLVALIEAALQAGFAPSMGTAVFSALHLLVFGVVQVWLFWRFGFVWMLAFRLAYYTLWHVAWGVARLELLF